MSTAIASKQSFQAADYDKPQSLGTLQKMGDVVSKSVAMALPSFMQSQAPAMLRALYTECQRQPRLLECKPSTLFGETIRAAQMGLMLGGGLGQCYLIPFKGTVNLVVGYKGYLQLTSRTGQSGAVRAYTVYDIDQFDYEYGSNAFIKHKPVKLPTAEEVKKRVAIAYYATCKTNQGEAFVVMSKAEAEQHRDKFAMARKGGGTIVGPWVDHFDSMAMKTCIIKLCKYLPMTAELQHAVRHDELQTDGLDLDGAMIFREQLELDSPVTKTESLTARLEAARTPAPSGQLFEGETADTTALTK